MEVWVVYCSEADTMEVFEDEKSAKAFAYDLSVYDGLILRKCTIAKENKESIKDSDTAQWKIWGGWRGNHDQRIDGAICNCCGYEHTTVYGSTSKLSDYCPKCGRKMVGIIEQ